ncbi:MAG: ATP-binding protein [Candidatus Riflebacteria bacterium]|nr:ATP-binding protein [Candidatus Riflebacteria bacterium]
MLLQQTINTLQQLRLSGMLKALTEQEANPEIKSLSFEERFGLLVDRESIEQANKRLNSRLKMARLRQNAVIEDFDWKTIRGLNKTFIMELTSCEWIRRKQNILILGPTGVGKTFLACSLAHKACREGFSSLYHRTNQLLHELAVSRGDGRYLKLIKNLSKPDLIILDDWGLETFNQDQRQDILEITEERYDRKSMIIVSQLPVKNWHDLIGEPTHAEATLDRIIHNSHIIEMKGDSMRKKMSKITKSIS